MKLSERIHHTQPRRIFIDATYTLSSGKSSGIERVVRNVLRECQEMSREGVLPDCRQVVSYGGKFYEVGPPQIEGYRRTAVMHKNILETLPPFYRRFASALCNAIPSQKIRKWFLPEPGHLGIFKLVHTCREALAHRRVARQCRPIAPRAGDLYLLPDAYWVNRLRDTIWPAAAEARQAGAKVATVLYDLIPLTHPEFVGQERSAAFLNYVKQVASNSDLIVAISKTVRDQANDLLRSLESPEVTYCDDVRWFELGCELNASTGGKVRRSVRAAFEDGLAPYLMVATFDPRKNHGFLLDAFDQMWRDGDHRKLCFVGRFGSQCDQTVGRIQSHPQYGKNLFLFNDLSDGELQYCYRKSRGVIFPSVVEGFGLPIVESLWFGKKTFVSDTAIHREVGQRDCVYFRLDDTADLVRELRQWDACVAQGQDHLDIQRNLITWRVSAEQIAAHCTSLFQAPPTAPSATRDAA